MRTLLFTLAFLALTTDVALAQAPGINLSWNDCTASVGMGLNATSSCTSNTAAAKSLYGTYVLPPGGVLALAGNDIVLDIDVVGTTLPCWWNYTLAPRNVGYAVRFDTVCPDAAGIGILDYWSTIPGGPSGSALASLVSGVPQRIRVTATVSVDATQVRPAPDNTEIYSFTFRLDFDATVGSCTGCLEPACFMLRLIRVTQAGHPNLELTQASSRSFLTWQGGAIGAPGCPPIEDPLPVLNRTWGSVRALYR